MSGHRTRLAVLTLLVAALAILPHLASRYVVNVLLLICVYVALASMWNLLAGYSGMVSLGQQMFIGLGGYTLAVLSLYYGVPIFLSVLFGGMVSVILALCISMSVFRMKGVYFAIGTWVIAEALGICFSNWGYVRYGMGLFIQPAYRLSMVSVYYAAVIICLVSLGLVYFLLRSKLGLALMAIRDNDVASEALGVNIFRCKLTCFLISAFITGAGAGILYLNTIFIQPFEAFGIGWTVKLLFIVIIGGIGTVGGPIVGAIIFVLLQQFLSEYVGYNLIILGAITIGVIFFAPRGILGTLQMKLGFELFPIRRQ
ncbi:MAG: branched-chain amino acid ABC transporter permease [Deltaproteobacteria bacterium]|nr:MAG: branched-chain amino acid ABC transporter permease [Deltaproteobacteria bacterium]